MGVKDIFIRAAAPLTVVKARPIDWCFDEAIEVPKWGRSDDLQYDNGKLEHARKCCTAAKIFA